ncbi:MAG: ATP-binding protein, partial [Actinomycetota bacterium]|nr:ATP-binding protein [Actinomycetota bacterium]
LVSNAVEYNRVGGKVSVGLRTEGGARILTVADSGIGIRQQDLPRIFERFYRVDTARSRETGGTGLGLSIVRHAVERHSGTVQVESALGEGTTFRVTLPIGADS